MVTGNHEEMGYEGVHWVRLAHDHGSGFCKHGEEASSSATRRQKSSNISE